MGDRGHLGHYPATTRWAHALHQALPQIDGLVLMSRRWNTDPAVVLFGDRVAAADLSVDPDMRILAALDGFEWLADLCARVGVAVLPPV